MEKKIIIEGDEKIVDVIIKENKHRVTRGLVKFLEVKERAKKKFGKDIEDTKDSGNDNSEDTQK